MSLMRWFRYYLLAVALSWLVLSPPDILAHHANLADGQRDFLHSDLPHSDTVVNLRDYTLFLTVIDRAPSTVDILLYLEDAVKRPVFGKRAVVIETDGKQPVFSGVIEPDKTGVFHLRYAYDKPLAARLKVSYNEADYSPAQWIEAGIQLGSPAPNTIILVLLGAALLAAIVVVGMRNRGAGQ